MKAHFMDPNSKVTLTGHFRDLEGLLVFLFLMHLGDKVSIT